MHYCELLNKLNKLSLGQEKTLMTNSKAIILIKSLTSNQLMDLEESIKKKHPKSLTLKTFRFIKKTCDSSIEGKLNKEALHTALFKDKPYNDVNIRFHLSKLAKLIQQFIVDSKPSSQFESSIYFLKHCREKRLHKLFEKQFSIELQKLKDSKKRNQDFYHKQYLLEIEYQAFRSSYAQTTKRHTEFAGKNKISAIDKFFTLSKLKQICSELNYQKTFQTEENITLGKETIKLVEENTTLREESAINIYYLVYQTLVAPEEIENFHQLQSSISANSSVFEHDEARELYIFAQNYCIRKVNSGAPKFLNTLFNLYKESIEKQLIYQNGELSPWDYKNIVSLALRLDQLTWTKQFIEEEKLNISPDERENAYSYNLANYHFVAQKYAKAIQLLLAVEYKDVFYQLGAKTILLKSYYELDEFDAMYSLLESFKTLLNRKKDISKNNKMLYINFIKILKKLIRTTWREEQKVSLKEQLAKTKLLAERAWLNRKLEER